MPKQKETSEELWRRQLLEGEAAFRWMRRLFRALPSSPRCKMCLNPFAGVGGFALRFAGFAPSRKNPLFCNR